MSSNTYAEVMRVLSNVRSIRALVRDSDYELLLEAHEKLGVALEERKEDFAAEKLQREARDAKRQELVALIEAEGFTLGELTGDVFEATSSKKTRRARTKREPKYTFVEEGETKFWAGVGRKPRPIAEAIKGGGSLSDFLIKPAHEDQQSLDV
ncbi:H-NS family nucleoid-associated regulatory protein [Pseudomonas amygdali pv. morsprunorum]|uniref:H-NS family histone-like protein n=1 Tax=Pseudomonas amygdali TaxID=47877 RepID=UPI0028909370|nr:H-NS family nucleoid-associated regulatory protein [Pseudomonas amygdali]MDT3268726.1 H-NS family nucleoid-associated regulatory protein [Pseudomonas amygdali pv. morsprunorum]